MIAKPSTRAELIRSLLAAPHARAARRLVRVSPTLADARAARLLLRRFSPLPLEGRVRAEAVVRAAEAIAANDRTPASRSVALRLSGVLAHLDGRAARARAALGEATELFLADGHLLEGGDTQRILVDVLMRAEDYAGAERMARLARQSYARAGTIDARRMGGLEMNLGNVHHRRNEHRAALEAYGRARRHYLTAGDRLRVAFADYNRANVLTWLDRTVPARALYEGARSTFARHRSGALVAQADFALAGLDLVEGQLDPCLDRLRGARERLAALGDRLRVAHADLDAAEALLRLNRPVEAERSARSADDFFRRAGQLAESAMCAAACGGALLQRGRPRRAGRLFARGRELARRLANPVAAAIYEIGEAQAELQAGRAASAARRAARAAGALARHGLGSRQARALAVAAEARLAAGRLGAARALASRAQRLARRHRDARVVLQTSLTLGRIAERRGASAEAYRHFRTAERGVERLRRGITSEESQLAFALDKSDVYEALILNRLRRGGRRAIREALAFAERGKARALVERLARGPTSLFPAASARTRRLLERLAEVERRLALAERRVADPASPPGVRSARAADLDGLVERRLHTLERLARQDPGRATLAGAPLADPLAGLATLGPDELVLEYASAGGRFHLFAIERDRIEAFPEIAEVSEIADRVRLLRFQLSKGVLGEDHAARFGDLIEATIRGHLERLHDDLLRPVADRLEGKLVRIVPHGVLHGLPFHAMESGGVALIDRAAVAYVPSLTTLSLLARRMPAPARGALVLGVADSAAPLIRREIDVVRRRLRGARVFRGRHATRDVLRRSEEGPPLLHVACHGLYSEDGPWSSGLRLGDTWVALPDLYAMRGMAQLVVLSGCETGRGTVYSGDEWVGLVRGFFQAGACTVVASLWEVHDRCTVSLMEDFYGGLAGGQPVAQALRQAQRSARRREPLPLRWAPFVVIGDPSLRMSQRRVA